MAESLGQEKALQMAVPTARKTVDLKEKETEILTAWRLDTLKAGLKVMQSLDGSVLMTVAMMVCVTADRMAEYLDYELAEKLECAVAVSTA